MAMTRFDSGALGQNLLLYYNPGEPTGEPTVDGSDNITSLPPGYAGKGPNLVPRDELNGECKYTDTTFVGDNQVCHALSFTTGTVAGLIGSLGGLEFPNGMTTVMVVENDTGNMMAYEVQGSLSIRDVSGFRSMYATTSRLSVLAGDRGLLPAYGSAEDHITTNGVPISHILSTSAEVSDTETRRYLTRYVNDQVTGTTSWPNASLNTTAVTGNTLVIGGNITYTSGITGRIALFALYDRSIDASESVDLLNLCQSWIDTGAGPTESDLDLSTSFGPVMPNDLSATLHWEVWLDTYQDERWDPYTVLTDASLSTDKSAEPSIPDGFNNVLNINSATTADNCKVRCRATTSYTDAFGIVTPFPGPTRLSVVEAS